MIGHMDDGSHISHWKTLFGARWMSLTMIELWIGGNMDDGNIVYLSKCQNTQEFSFSRKQPLLQWEIPL